jgi:hypothetical protein
MRLFPLSGDSLQGDTAVPRRGAAYGEPAMFTGLT